MWFCFVYVDLICGSVGSVLYESDLCGSVLFYVDLICGSVGSVLYESDLCGSVGFVLSRSCCVI